MGKQKRKQAEPEVSDKALNINKKSKPVTKKLGAKSAKSPVELTPNKNVQPTPEKPESTTTTPKTAEVTAKKKSDRSSGQMKRAASAAVAESNQPPLADLPTMDTDAQLKQIAEKSRQAERLAEKEEESSREVVKVKRSQPSLKLKESTAKSYLSITGGPAEDDKMTKVPSYSHIKNRGIVYISHVPHGFYEKQMRDFFSQFGVITNLRLGRSRKTGRSRGYAFVEFKYEEVAKVVAETMNNYLMFDKILKVELVSGERKSRAVFMGKIKPTRPPLMKSRMKAKALHNADKSSETEQKRQARTLKKVARLKTRLASAGINYDIQIS